MGIFRVNILLFIISIFVLNELIHRNYIPRIKIKNALSATANLILS